MMNDIQNKLQFATDNYWTLAQSRWPELLDHDAPTVTFIHGGRAAGHAYYSEHRVRFNTALAERYPGEFLKQVVGHEVAHIVAYALYGPKRGSGHGRAWQSVMRGLGLKPDRTHSWNTSDIRLRKTETFAYSCACGPIELGKIRHRRALRGTKYRCGNCRQQIQPVREAPLIVRVKS